MNKITLTKVIVGKQQVVKTVDMSPYAKVVIELGCGDGRYAYTYAKANPGELIIATDADKSQMETMSRKAAAKPERGGVANLIYLWSATEMMPLILEGRVNEVQINFPWGKLLSGILLGEADILESLAMLLNQEAKFRVVTTYSDKFEPETIQALGLPSLDNLTKLSEKLTPLYLKYDLQIDDMDYLEAEVIPSTTWWKKIGQRRERKVVEIIGHKQ